jgi:hypothetical protein
MKFLIDECLSPELALRARERGHAASTHVVWLGKGGWKDWNLKPLILDGDWTFVTQNAVDFRGPPASPGSQGAYADVAINAGLICLNGPATGMDLNIMGELFEVALHELEQDGDLVNQVLEVNLEGDEIRILRYRLPEGEGG